MVYRDEWAEFDGALLDGSPSRRCKGCEQDKANEEFYRTPSGYRRTCKKCVLERQSTYIKQLDPNEKQRRQRTQTLKKYGLSDTEFDRLLDDQQHRCKICLEQFTEMRDPKIDHCHTSGQVRGLLCVTCNAGLGSFKDDAEMLARAISYLGNQPPRSSVETIKVIPESTT